jgi:hypothetical protein
VISFETQFGITGQQSKWANMGIWAYWREFQMSRTSKHPLRTGHSMFIQPLHRIPTFQTRLRIPLRFFKTDLHSAWSHNQQYFLSNFLAHTHPGTYTGTFLILWNSQNIFWYQSINWNRVFFLSNDLCYLFHIRCPSFWFTWWLSKENIHIILWS